MAQVFGLLVQDPAQGIGNDRDNHWDYLKRRHPIPGERVHRERIHANTHNRSAVVVAEVHMEPWQKTLKIHVKGAVMRKVKLTFGVVALGLGALIAMDFWPIHANSSKTSRKRFRGFDDSLASDSAKDGYLT